MRAHSSSIVLLLSGLDASKLRWNSATQFLICHVHNYSMLRTAPIVEQGARAVVTERHIRTEVSELRKLEACAYVRTQAMGHMIFFRSNMGPKVSDLTWSIQMFWSYACCFIWLHLVLPFTPEQAQYYLGEHLLGNWNPSRLPSLVKQNFRLQVHLFITWSKHVFPCPPGPCIHTRYKRLYALDIETN